MLSRMPKFHWRENFNRGLPTENWVPLMKLLQIIHLFSHLIFPQTVIMYPLCTIYCTRTRYFEQNSDQKWSFIGAYCLWVSWRKHNWGRIGTRDLEPAFQNASLGNGFLAFQVDFQYLKSLYWCQDAWSTLQFEMPEKTNKNWVMEVSTPASLAWLQDWDYSWSEDWC